MKMKLSGKYLEKADDSLREALEQAAEDESMRVILTLDEDKCGSVQSIKNGLSPSDFESRTEFRKALVNRRKNLLAEQFAETRKKLRDARLELRGGEISRVIVVDGNARDIARSLSIPGVLRVTLDKKISIPAPTKSKLFTTETE